MIAKITAFILAACLLTYAYVVSSPKLFFHDLNGKLSHRLQVSILYANGDTALLSTDPNGTLKIPFAFNYQNIKHHSFVSFKVSDSTYACEGVIAVKLYSKSSLPLRRINPNSN